MQLITQDAELPGIPVLENHFKPPIVIKISQGKSAAIVLEIQPQQTGNL